MRRARMRIATPPQILRRTSMEGLLRMTHSIKTNWTEHQSIEMLMQRGDRACEVRP